MATKVLAVLSLGVLANSESLNNILFNGDYEFIDLSHPFDNNTVYWPGARKFQFTQKKEGFTGSGKSWYASKDFEAGEHGGTHLDAPYHFAVEGKTVDQLPLEKLILPLIIVDVSSLVNDDPNFILYKHHLDHMINNNNGKPFLIIFKFGWSKYFYTNRYLGIDQATGTINFPGLSGEVAEWLVSFKNVVGVGVDVASVDRGASADFPTHRALAAAGIFNMENVNLHRPIPDAGCTAIALPMKIATGTGAPLRLVAICPKQTPTTF